MSQGQSLSGHYQDELSGHSLLLLFLYSHSNTSRKCTQLFQLWGFLCACFTGYILVLLSVKTLAFTQGFLN